MTENQSVLLQLNEAAHYQISLEKRNAAQIAAVRIRTALDELAALPSVLNVRAFNSAIARGFRTFQLLDPMPVPPSPRTEQLREVA